MATTVWQKWVSDWNEKIIQTFELYVRKRGKKKANSLITETKYKNERQSASHCTVYLSIYQSFTVYWSFKRMVFKNRTTGLSTPVTTNIWSKYEEWMKRMNTKSGDLKRTTRKTMITFCRLASMKFNMRTQDRVSGVQTFQPSPWQGLKATNR